MTVYTQWKRLVVITLMTVALWPLGNALAEEETKEKAAEQPPTKVAEVNGTVIPYSDFTYQLNIMKQRLLRGRPGQLPEPMMQQLRSRVVDQMVAEELLFQESQKKGIKITPQKVEAELLNLKQRFGTEESYQAALKRTEMTEEKLKGQIAHQAAIRELVESEISSKVEVTEADSKKYFEENADKFRSPEQVRASHILIKVEKGDDDKKKAAARKKLEDIKKKVLAGDDFGKLAKENSEGPSNTRGGDLGFFTRGRMVKNFEEVAFKLAPNEVSDIVETQFGYHLIKVVDRKEAHEASFDEVKERIDTTLRQERVQNMLEPYVAKLKEAAKVETFLTP